MESKPSKKSDDKKKSSKPKAVPKEKKTKTLKAKKLVKGKIGGMGNFNTACPVDKITAKCINPSCIRPDRDERTCCVNKIDYNNGSTKSLYTCTYCGACTESIISKSGYVIQPRTVCPTGNAKGNVKGNAKGNNGNARGNGNTKY